MTVGPRLLRHRGWQRGFQIFWLLGPFILLIERSPADAWLTILALAFVVRAVIKRDGWFFAGILGCGQPFSSGVSAFFQPLFQPFQPIH